MSSNNSVADHAAGRGLTVRYNGRGKIFEVAKSTIMSKPETLLAKMLDEKWSGGKQDESSSGSSNVAGAYFVDVNPSRFECVLDWYR